MKNKIVLGSLLSLLSASAYCATVDFSSTIVTLSADIAEYAEDFAPVVGLIVAVFLGYRFLKRIAR